MVVNKKTTCNLKGYKKDRCAGCTALCTHHISLHGLNDNGGRITQARIPKDYRRYTLENSPVRNSQPEIYNVLDYYVKETFSRHMNGGERVKSLYLWSEQAGTGKTTTAIVLLNEWINIEYLNALKNGQQPPKVSGAFLDINALQSQYNLATMSKNEDELKDFALTMKEMARKEFLVIDDIGVRRSTEAFRGYVHDLVNYRTVNGLPTIYTSNLPIHQMANVFDHRLADRIKDQCTDVFFSGTSHRGIREEVK